MRSPLAALVFAGAMTHALAHSWYPWECCSERDCFPISIPRSEIARTETGWFLKKERITIPFDAVRSSPDGQFHICRTEAGEGTLITPHGKPPCLWVPEVEG
jgi:hypothetical protein